MTVSNGEQFVERVGHLEDEDVRESVVLVSQPSSLNMVEGVGIMWDIILSDDVLEMY